MSNIIKPIPPLHISILREANAPSQPWAEWFKAVDDFINGGVSGLTTWITQAQADARYEQLGLLKGINTQTGNYTLVLVDQGKTVEMNVAGANTLTVPPHSSVAFPVGAWFNFVQIGAGQTTVTPGAAVTFRGFGGAFKTAGQYAMGTAYQRATDEWVIGGRTVP